MRNVLTVAAAISLSLTGVTPARAQERPGAVYVGGAIALMQQDGVSGTESQTYVTAPGGTTTGWAVEAGVFVLRAMSVEAEFSTTGTMSAREPSRYGMTFNEERRDRFVWGAVRFHAPIGTLVDVEPLVGVGIVSTLVTSQTDWAGPPERLGPPYSDPKTTDTVPARPLFGFGCDVRIGAAHVAVVPSFRVMRAGAYPDFPTYYPGGVSRLTLRGGAALRLIF